MDRRKIQRQAASLNDKLYSEKQLHYIGRVKILLSNLRFTTTNDRRKQFPDKKTIKKLVQNFASEEENHVLALISKDVLQNALRRSNLTAESIRKAEPPPKLIIETPTPLKCLYGRNRLQAAHRLLEYGEDWLIVDLYSDECSLTLQNHFQEGYSNSTYFCDGEILRHIRLYQDTQDIINENKWWARLSQDKKKDLKRIINITAFRDIFDDLMNITGLWPAFHIGTFRRYLIINCHEELLNYLQRIYKVWSMIVGGNQSLMRHIDLMTVETLELRAPKTSSEDAKIILEAMEKRKIFRFVDDPKLRKSISCNILQVDYLVPSLRTFCEDTKYLEPCSNAVKLLVRLEHKETVDKALRRIYNPPESTAGIVTVQDSENSFTEVESSDSMRFHIAKLQIFLAAFRNFNNIVNIACRKDLEEAKPMVAVPNLIVIYQFAKLAYKLGFDSDQVQRLLSIDPRIEEIYSCLVRLDPSKEKNEEELRLRAQNYATIWNKDNAVKDSNMSTVSNHPLLTDRDQDQTLAQRCGRPFQKAHIQDKEFLFLRHIYSSDKTTGRYITSFYVKQATFIAFFGDFKIDDLQEPNPLTSRDEYDTGGAGAVIDEYMRAVPQEFDNEDLMDVENDPLTIPAQNHHVSSLGNRSSDIEMGGDNDSQEIANSHNSEPAPISNLEMVFFHGPKGEEDQVPLDPQRLLEYIKALPNNSLIIENHGSQSTVVPAHCYNFLKQTGIRNIQYSPMIRPTSLTWTGQGLNPEEEEEL
ncbi:uncharacterized protein EAF01_010140 [Botrytis porri]|uniref:uncharacterized protein n=1 Tax=Botrytis porri TaxID=87229 RepID=UPI001900E55E|nr:uncharacterized protein EAF01_010140 [Botrytis porri]KAF7894690.1 hypothetical protein EAF01_010140 [Botrytis porri]